MFCGLLAMPTARDVVSLPYLIQVIADNLSFVDAVAKADSKLTCQEVQP